MILWGENIAKKGYWRRMVWYTRDAVVRYMSDADRTTDDTQICPYQNRK